MKKLLVFISICSLGVIYSFQHLPSFKTLVLNRLAEYTSEKYPEKIYVHTDKPYYTAGEDIWFSAYLLNGINHQYSSKSRVVYVELLNEKDSIISERKLFVEETSEKGDFKLPMDIKDGIYHLRAYTTYMRNQSQDFFFKKKIPVYGLYSDALDPSETKKKQVSNENLEMPDIGFYPEGGYLISGLRNKVAIKIKDANLDAQDLTGTIEDKDGNKVAQFTTKEFGLGSFYLLPEAGKEYHAIVKSGNEEHIYPLPIPLDQGYVMNATFSGENIAVNVQTNKEGGLKKVLIIGHQRGTPVFDYYLVDNIKSISLQIPKSELIEGVLNLVLFDAENKPVAERLLFIHKEDEISVSIKKTSGPTKTRDKVDLEIEVNDSYGKLIPSSISLSVIDSELIPPTPNAENIKTWLLLNSDLRGKIQEPNYFFTKNNIEHKQELLDLILMTHGWRRFIWQEFMESSPSIVFEPEDGIYIDGHTISSKTPYQHKMSETKLTFRYKGFYQETQKTGEHAYFKYGPFEYKDTIDVILMINTEKPTESETNIILKGPLKKPSIAPDELTSSFNWPIADVKTYREKSRTNVLKDFKYNEDYELLDEVIVKGEVKTKEEIQNIKRVERARANNPSHRVLVEALDTGVSGDFMSLIENLPGVRMELIDDPFIFSKSVISLHGAVPEFYVDNVRVGIDDARSVSQSNIDFIDVIRAGGSGSTQYSGSGLGIIAIYTKKGSRGKSSVDYSKKIGMINFRSPGFYTAREFFSPDYATDKDLAKREDRRSTLYWNPKLITRFYQSAAVSFYSSDDRGRFQIEVQGITNKGIPIYQTAILEVE